jgi:hypothetical protein
LLKDTLLVHFAARYCLVNCFMSLFPLPTRVANRIEKLQCDFLLGRLGEELKYYLVSWPKVCSPIFGGGLEIKNLLRFNHALLGRWVWHYGLEREV